MSEMRLVIGGLARTLLHGTMQITEETNSRNTATFRLYDGDGSLDLETGMDVRVTENIAGHDEAFLHFAGTIDNPSEELIMTKGGARRFVSVSAVDYSQLADRFIVSEVFEDVPTEEIAAQLVSTYLAADGVVAGTITSGPTIPRKVFPNVKLKAAFDWLTEQTGYPWIIDYEKVFTLQAFGSRRVPITLSTSNRTISRIRRQRPRGAYRNRQYLRAGRDLTDVRTELFKGDGTRRTFNLAYPAGTEPTVTVNGVSETVGIKGVEQDKAWYWNKESNELSQADANG